MNIYSPFLIVLVEDKAHRDFVNGMKQELNSRQLRPETCNGWPKVLERCKDLVDLYKDNANMNIGVMIDLDNQGVNRISQFKNVVSQQMQPRLLIVGFTKDIEAFRTSWRTGPPNASKNSLEEIGKQVATDCPISENKFFKSPSVLTDGFLEVIVDSVLGTHT